MYEINCRIQVQVSMHMIKICCWHSKPHVYCFLLFVSFCYLWPILIVFPSFKMGQGNFWGTWIMHLCVLEAFLKGFFLFLRSLLNHTSGSQNLAASKSNSVLAKFPLQQELHVNDQVPAEDILSVGINLQTEMLVDISSSVTMLCQDSIFQIRETSGGL